jgi:hypothetical protein
MIPYALRLLVDFELEEDGRWIADVTDLFQAA